MSTKRAKKTMINNSILKTTLIAMGLCAFAAPAFSSTVLTFSKGNSSGIANGTIVSGTGNMDISQLKVDVNGNASTYTFTTGGFLHFDFTDTVPAGGALDTFNVRTTGATTSGNNTLATTSGTGAPGAIQMTNIAATTGFVTATSSLAVVNSSGTN